MQLSKAATKLGFAFGRSPTTNIDPIEDETCRWFVGNGDDGGNVAYGQLRQPFETIGFGREEPGRRICVRLGKDRPAIFQLNAICRGKVSARHWLHCTNFGCRQRRYAIGERTQLVVA